MYNLLLSKYSGPKKPDHIFLTIVPSINDKCSFLREARGLLLSFPECYGGDSQTCPYKPDYSHLLEQRNHRIGNG